MGSEGNGGRRRIARLLNNSIFYMVLLVCALTAIPYGTVEPWWKAVFQCSVFGLGFLWVIEGLLSGSWFVSRHRVLVPLLALMVFAIVQMKLPLRSVSASGGGGSAWRVLSFSPYDTQMFVYDLLALIVVSGLLIRYTSSRRRFKILVLTVIGIGLSSTVFGLVRHTFQKTPGFLLPYLRPDLGDGLPGVGYGQFINHNHFAFLAEMSLGLLLGLIVYRGLNLRNVIFGLAAVIPMSVAIIYSGSRGGLIAMLGQVLFLALLFFVIKPGRELLREREGQGDRVRRLGQFLFIRTVLLASLIVLMVIAIVRVGGDPLADRLQSAQQEEFANTHDKYANTFRLKIWPTTWKLIKDNPVAGVGFGGYWIAIAKYHKGSGEFTPQQAHNDYLDLFASGGLIAIAIGVWFIILFMKELSLSWPTPDRFIRASRFGALAGIFAIAIHSFVDFGLHVTINALVFMILIVITTANVGGDVPTKISRVR